MTTFDSSFGEPALSGRKTSGLAVASLVCSLICCIPPLPLIGLLLGVGGVISIGNNPARKGKGLAIAGIILGLVFTVAHAILVPLGYKFYKVSTELVMNGPSGALAAGFAGDIAGFKGDFHGAGASAPDAEAAAFIEALRDRYGNLVGCSFNPNGPPPQQNFGKPSVPFPYVLHFDNATVDCTTEIVFSDAQKGGFIMKLGWITVHDPDQGDLTYPFAATGNAPAPPGGAAPMPMEDDEAPVDDEAEEPGG